MGHSKADFINTFGGDLGPKLFDESRDYTRKFQDVKNDPTGLLMQQAGEEFWDAAIKEVLGGYSSYDEWKQAQGFAPGGLALTMYPAITPLVVDPGARTRIGAHLTKNGVPYYAGALAPHFSGGYANVELYANGVKIAEKLANQGAGDWAGLALFDVTAPSTIGPWAITLRYKEKVDNPVTRLPETNSAATSFVIQVGPTGTGQPIVVIPTRFGTLLRVLAQIAVQGVERIFAIPQAPTFFANETMKIVAYIAYKGTPVKDYAVTFTVDNQEIGDMKTDEKGYAYMPFRIPLFGETIQQQFTRTTNGSATIKSTVQGEKRHRLCVKVKTEEGDVEDCQMIVVSSEAITGEIAPVGYEAYLAALRA
ncbi:hypothetical protein KKH23_07395, partial [Patescibacteria group bacterium]|nr:hypothetical protein [Patescibacteria group bacterium]